MRYEVIAAIRDSNLSSMEKLFLMTVESRNNEKNDGYFATRDRLCTELGMAESTMYKNRDSLIKSKCLEVDIKGYKEQSIYKVLPDGLKNLVGPTVRKKVTRPGRKKATNVEEPVEDSKSENDSEDQASQEILGDREILSGGEIVLQGREIPLGDREMFLPDRAHKDNVKKNIEEEQEEQLSIYKNIVKEEVLSLSEKSGVPPDLLNPESSVADAPSLSSNQDSSLISEQPSLLSNQESVRSEPIIEKKYVFVDWKNVDWNMPAANGEDDWGYYSIWLDANKEKRKEWEGKHGWSRGPGWETKISDHCWELMKDVVDKNKNQEELENASW